MREKFNLTMRKIDKMVARSKEFVTETEEDNYSSTGQAGGQDNGKQMQKGGSGKKSFNVHKIMEAMEQQRKKSAQIFKTKVLAWVMALFWVMIGHFYASTFILWSASLLHKEVISTGQILRKDAEIKFSWLDVYWYMVGTYIAIPYVFLRRSITETLIFESWTIKMVLYQYHSLISQSLFFIGAFLTMIKLNRGFVKYQMRRTLWTMVSLGYVFMLSTVQIYNLYQGYIWVVCPILCVRFNGFMIKTIYNSRSQKHEPIHKFLPERDRTSIIIAFFATCVFAWWISG